MSQTELMLDNDELEIITQAAAKKGLSVAAYIEQANSTTTEINSQPEMNHEQIHWS